MRSPRCPLPDSVRGAELRAAVCTGLRENSPGAPGRVAARRGSLRRRCPPSGGVRRLARKFPLAPGQVAARGISLRRRFRPSMVCAGLRENSPGAPGKSQPEEFRSAGALRVRRLSALPVVVGPPPERIRAQRHARRKAGFRARRRHEARGWTRVWHRRWSAAGANPRAQRHAGASRGFRARRRHPRGSWHDGRSA